MFGYRIRDLIDLLLILVRMLKRAGRYFRVVPVNTLDDIIDIVLDFIHFKERLHGKHTPLMSFAGVLQPRPFAKLPRFTAGFAGTVLRLPALWARRFVRIVAHLLVTSGEIVYVDIHGAHGHAQHASGGNSDLVSNRLRNRADIAAL